VAVAPVVSAAFSPLFFIGQESDTEVFSALCFIGHESPSQQSQLSQQDIFSPVEAVLFFIGHESPVQQLCDAARDTVPDRV
jgi:hypothetical protein